MDLGISVSRALWHILDGFSVLLVLVWPAFGVILAPRARWHRIPSAHYKSQGAFGKAFQGMILYAGLTASISMVVRLNNGYSILISCVREGINQQTYFQANEVLHTVQFHPCNQAAQNRTESQQVSYLQQATIHRRASASRATLIFALMRSRSSAVVARGEG